MRGESETYLWSGQDDTGHFRGFHVRNDHPDPWEGDGAAPDLLASGARTLLLDLGDGLQTGGELVVAFGPSCANDVLFERISAPVPEPGAALVFAAGLAVVARRRVRA